MKIEQDMNQHRIHHPTKPINEVVQQAMHQHLVPIHNLLGHYRLACVEESRNKKLNQLLTNKLSFNTYINSSNSLSSTIISIEKLSSGLVAYAL